MTYRKLSEEQRAYLESLPAVERVSPSGRIHYAREFQILCMRRYRNGDRPSDIFREAGMGSEVIGYKRIERCISRWRDLPDEPVRQPRDLFDHGCDVVPGNIKTIIRVNRRIHDLERRIEELEKENGSR